MDQDIQSQLDRAKELMQDLEKACNVDLQAKDVSEKTKNLTQEVLLKIRHLLDQAIRKFFEKYYFNGLSDYDKKSTKVHFPIVSKKGDLKFLGNVKMNDIIISHKDFYKFIDSVQPYNPGYLWLKYLRNYSNEKHIRLTPQTIKKENETRLGNAVRVGRGAVGVSMSNCLINGILVNSKDINAEPLENFDPRLGVQRVTWISFVFSDTDINILQLCKKSVEDGEKIIKSILEFV
ncbi:MAG: hypothetical protein NTU58_00945 [Candidatus Nealsonbacteria bacterium]|nr:hypothetical protein [Candidatus Nealsonbacteria bacterium]